MLKRQQRNVSSSFRQRLTMVLLLLKVPRLGLNSVAMTEITRAKIQKVDNESISR